MSTTATKKIIISKSKLRSVIKQQIKNAFKSELLGWNIPIYVTPNVEEEAEISAGEWQSSNSFIEPLCVYRVHSWDLTDELGENEDEESTLESLSSEYAEAEVDEIVNTLEEKPGMEEYDIEFVD